MRDNSGTIIDQFEVWEKPRLVEKLFPTFGLPGKYYLVFIVSDGLIFVPVGKKRGYILFDYLKKASLLMLGLKQLFAFGTQWRKIQELKERLAKLTQEQILKEEGASKTAEADVVGIVMQKGFKWVRVVRKFPPKIETGFPLRVETKDDLSEYFIASSRKALTRERYKELLQEFGTIFGHKLKLS